MVDSVVKKVIGRLKFLYRYSSYLNQSLHKNLCAALVQCHLDYCCTAWFSSVSTRSRYKLQITQNKIVRFIMNLSQRTHVDQLTRNSVKLLSTLDRVKQLWLNHVYNIFNGSSPPYLTHNFTRLSRSHTHHTRSSSFNFFIPRVRGMASKSFYYNAILDWNALPPHIQTISNKLEFKRQSRNTWLRLLWGRNLRNLYVCRLIVLTFFCPWLLLAHSHLLLFLDLIGNQPARVAGLYGLSWPCNLLVSVVVPVIPVSDGIW